jgi:hypothetical protein
MIVGLPTCAKNAQVIASTLVVAKYATTEESSVVQTEIKYNLMSSIDSRDNCCRKCNSYVQHGIDD